MKHKLKIILILLGLFILAQIVGLGVLNLYHSTGFTSQISDSNSSATSNISSLIIGFVIAIILFAFFMKIKATFILKLWFALVISIALWITLYSVMQSLQYGALISLLLLIPLVYYKIVKRNILIHNLTEVLIYPGIAVLFVPLLSITSTIVLLILISVYDMYAVWHAKFMQKMAMYQMQHVKVFSGLLIPYMLKAEKGKKINKKNKKMNLAMLGGGDIVFPIIASGVMLFAYGLIPALITTLGATLGLLVLFIFSEKGKFYPAMPFIASGCLIAMGLATLI